MLLAADGSRTVVCCSSEVEWLPRPAAAPGGLWALRVTDGVVAPTAAHSSDFACRCGSLELGP
eukprot:13599940-Heterocapsa_arctica.AAC.1